MQITLNRHHLATVPDNYTAEQILAFKIGAAFALGKAYALQQQAANDYNPNQPRKKNGEFAASAEKRERKALTALKMLSKEKPETCLKDFRKDLEQYGGSSDVYIKLGEVKPKHKGHGILHIADKHGNKAVREVIKAIANGKIAWYSETKQTVAIDLNGYEAILSLKENGNKKTWLLTGYDIKP